MVLGPGWPGILLHEAVGHGLEADFNRKGVSAFSGRIGEQVASPLCTVIDDGTIGSRRGSLNVDDEGVPTQKNVLIENGILRGYLQDTLSARLLKSTSTGSGRRESYQHIPMPRMTNTYMLAGQSDPDEIIRSVPKGIYCATFGGGQVDITSGNFVFQATESYLIENGKLTRPVKGATLIGNGPEALKYVSMVGHDLQLDEGIGVCGKEGQSVPVGVGIPTVKIDKMTVGGTAASDVTDVTGNLLDIAAAAAKRAVELGASGAECTISEGEEFSASVRMREVENLKQAGSRGAGIRVLVGHLTGSSRTSDLSPQGIETMVRGALDLARITTPDPHAGLPDPADLGRFSGDLKLYERFGFRHGNRVENRPGPEGRRGRTGGGSAHHELGRRFVRFLPRLAGVRQFARIRRRVSNLELRPERGPGGQAERLHGTRLLEHLGARSFAS